MKILGLILLIHLFAYSMAKAEDNIGQAAIDQAPINTNSNPTAVHDGSSQDSAAVAASPQPSEQPIESGEVAPVSLLAKKASETAALPQDCQSLLPQLENDSRDLNQKYQALSQSLDSSRESYLTSFNDMTKELFEITANREKETPQFSQSRDQMREAMTKFNDIKTEESSKKLQETYMDLTVRIYNSLVESQKTFEDLKKLLSQVESARLQVAGTQMQLEELDRQKLNLESKLVSMKIKCQPEKNY